ncbi:MAG: SDR family oxidoreductase [Acidimicrobiales bacterium]|nr:SDR family oxidoreductase [Acidimicrobiales bacterium]
MTAPLTGKHALVTGGGTGIGLGCAARLLRDGATVTIAGRRADVLDEAAVALRAAAPEGAGVRVAVCDVTDEEQVAAAVATAADDAGALHIAVANAGGGGGTPFLWLTADQWRSGLDTNVVGAAMTMKHAGLAMQAHGGSIIAMSSISGVLGGRFRAIYAASKAALDMMVRVSADELGPFGIRVNSVRPGLVLTPTTSSIADPAQPNAAQDDYLANMPLGRLGTVDDVAELVRFLAGPESSWITGQAYNVDGGHTLRRGPNLEVPIRERLGDAAVDGAVGPRWS